MPHSCHVVTVDETLTKYRGHDHDDDDDDEEEDEDEDEDEEEEDEEIDDDDDDDVHYIIYTHYTKLHYELTIPAPETCTADFTTSSLSLNSVAAYLSHIMHICAAQLIAVIAVTAKE